MDHHLHSPHCAPAFIPAVASTKTLCVSLRRLRFTGFAARIKFPHPLLPLQKAVAVYSPLLAAG